MAAVVSDRLYQGFKFESDLLLLTPENWERTLEHGNPDFLLMESCWDTVTGHWYLAQTHSGEQQDMLLSILLYCRKHHIPTVYWHTQDFLYHDVFSSFAANFDFVFCADSTNIEYFRKNNIESELLLPAIQPAIHNPFRDFNVAGEFSLDILYDGWADILRLGDNLHFLHSLKHLGLSIIESQFRLFHTKLYDSKGLADNILGSVDWQDRLMAFKYAKLCVMADSTLSTTTLQQWKTLEIAACRVPVLYRGELETDDIRRDAVTAKSSDDELIEHASYLLKNNILRQKQAHLGWRAIQQNHTFSHRINQICNTIGISHDMVEHPPVSIVIATFREALLTRCIENFDKQIYPNKELILVMNSNSFSRKHAEGLLSERTDIRLHIVPSERVEGGCLNVGIMAAKGEFIIKMDDDDHYSAHYVSDMMLHEKSIDADVFGKANRYIHFMDDDTTYSRSIRPELTVIPSDKLLCAHISGNSLSGKTKFFQNKRYSDANFASTDTCYHGNTEGCAGTFALYDDFGLIMERSADVSNHSWRLTSESLKKRMEFLCNGISDDVLV